MGKALKISGLSFENLGEFKQAVTKFLQILKIFNARRNNDWSKYMIESTYSSLAFSYWKDGNDEMSEYYFQQLTSLKDAGRHELSQVYLCKAHCLYEKRRWKEALGHYNEALSLMDNGEEKQNYQKYIDDCEEKLRRINPGSSY